MPMPPLARRFPPFTRLLSIVLLATLMVSSSIAQPRIRIPAAPASQAIEVILEAGQQLETNQRWNAARDHYRDALRQFPDHDDLQSRLKTARMHTDLARRYHDASFVDAYRTTPLNRCVAGFGEIMLKVQAHHFHQPRWAAIARHCYRGLEIACSDKVFTSHHKLDPAAAETRQFLQQARQLLVDRPPATRQQLQEAVRLVARQGQQQLGLVPQAVVLECNCAAIMALDKYSSYLTPYQLDEMFSQIEGNFVGLGIELTTSDNRLKVVRVINNGPAHEAGIRRGDQIVTVAGQSIPQITADHAADLLRGPEGSPVTLTIVTAENKRRELMLRRRRVEVASVESVKILDRELGIGYFKIVSFQKSTGDDVDDALWKLHREGMNSLVIDIRDNPGGLLMGSVEVSDKFVRAGTIVSTRGRAASEDIDYQANELGTWKMPLVLLMNGNSASASEVFAGAIRDTKRGRIVGQTSYGKGSVQGIFPLTNTTAGIRLTTARFYSPSGRAISQQGVTPDVIVRMADSNSSPANAELDLVLQTGLDVLRHMVAERPKR
jgi:carboxyl-terminal processing protease